MKIETGKFYKTRDGRKVRIYATDGSNTYPVHGAFKEVSGWKIASFTESGKHLHGGFVNNSDIVSEWSDKQTEGEIGFDPSCLPAWTKYIAMDENFDWFAYRSKPEKSYRIWEPDEDDSVNAPIPADNG